MNMQQMIFDAMDDEQKKRVMAAQAERDKRTRDNMRALVVIVALVVIWATCLGKFGWFGVPVALVATWAFGWLCSGWAAKEPIQQTTN